MLDPHLAAQLIDLSASAIIVLGIALAVTYSLGRSIWLVAIQSVVTGSAAIVVGLATGTAHLVIGGLLALGVKGVVVPIVLGTIVRRSSVRRERHPILGRRGSLVAAVAIVFAASAAADGAFIGASIAADRALPAAIGTVLTGLLLLVTRRKAVSLIVGLLVFENGIALTAFSLTYGMPLVVELGVLFDVLIAAIVAWVYARRMLDVLGTTSSDRLRTLRG